MSTFWFTSYYIDQENRQSPIAIRFLFLKLKHQNLLFHFLLKMGNKSFGFLVVGCISLASLLCHTYSARLDSDELLYYSIRQYTKLSMSLAGKDVFINTGNPLSSEWNRSPLSAWTVGFYGGSLWILYKLSHDEYWKNLALEYQERIKSRQFDRGTHDVGFVIMSTYGLAMEYGNDNSEETRDYYTQIIHESATSLSSRYNCECSFLILECNSQLLT